jgi:hypothetical protein
MPQDWPQNNATISRDCPHASTGTDPDFFAAGMGTDPGARGLKIDLKAKRKFRF